MSEHMQFFLRYAFSCAYVLRNLGQMSTQDYQKLEQAALNGEDVTTDELERLFPAAYRRLKVVADQYGKQPWDKEIVMDYFPKEHNKFIDQGDGNYGCAPEWFKEHCKVKQLEVLEKKTIGDKLFLRVDNKRWVQSPFFSDVKIGDKVRVHHAYAVEYRAADQSAVHTG